MKMKNWKKRFLTVALLVIAMVALVEFQKWMKRQAPNCVNGICKLPDEKAGAIVGPHSVPLLVSTNQQSLNPTCKMCIQKKEKEDYE